MSFCQGNFCSIVFHSRFYLFILFDFNFYPFSFPLFLSCLLQKREPPVGVETSGGGATQCQLLWELLLLLGVHHPGLAIPHEGLVVLDEVHSVMEFPATPTEVAEASSLPAEVRTLTEGTVGAESVLKIGINLNLKIT